ncbi:MAG: GNAT family N-acetyltransferase [Thermoplasmata archaeon]|nr:GNAT family N-acetyltransferase [Thermoplasmata archaeon]
MAPPKTVTAKPIIVERLTHHDIPEICALYKRVWEPRKAEIPADLLKAWTPTALEFSSSMEGVTYFAARRDGKLIGGIGCWLDDGACQILHLAVDVDQRRQGVATALTNAAIEWARHNNSFSVWVDALSKLEDAGAMFKRLGFSECGLLHRHQWSEDVRLFEKVL